MKDRYVIKNSIGQYADGRRGWVEKQKFAFIFDQREGETQTARDWAYRHLHALYAFDENDGIKAPLYLARLV